MQKPTAAEAPAHDQIKNETWGGKVCMAGQARVQIEQIRTGYRIPTSSQQPQLNVE